jgi:predicted permease
VLDDLVRDVRLGARALRRTPTVTAVAVLTLAVAIGANAAIFSLYDRLLIRDLPVSRPEQLASVSSDYAIGFGFSAGAGWSDAMWTALESRDEFFGGALAWHAAKVALGERGEYATGDALFVSGDFFPVLGVAAERGRVYSSRDLEHGADASVVGVLSYRAWRRRFAARPDIIGAAIDVNGVPVTIVGVSARTFNGLDVGRGFDIAIPLAAEPLVRGGDAARNQPRSFSLLVMLRLRDGQTFEAATRVLRSMQSEIVPARGAPSFVSEPFTLVPAAGGAANVGSPSRLYRQPLQVMTFGVAMVLLVACVNIASILLVRTIARERELSIRLAVGASRWRLVRSLFVEAGLLAIAGAGLGVLLATWAAAGLAAMASVTLDLSLDWRLLAFTGTVAFAAILAVGFLAGLRTSKAVPADALRLGDRATSARTAGVVLDALTAAQFAVATTVVVAAVLTLSTFAELAGRPLGFDADRVLVADVRRGPLAPASERVEFQPLVDAVAALPGVGHAGASLWTPLGGGGLLVSIGDDRGETPPEARSAVLNLISPGWFATYGMPLHRGRDFGPEDARDAPSVVVVNEALARGLAPDGGVLGRTILDGRVIVGVVANAVSRSAQRIPGLASLALREPVPPTIYAPVAQAPQWALPPGTRLLISIRTTGSAFEPSSADLRRAIASVDRLLIVTVHRVSDDVATSLAQERMMAALSGIFGSVAVLLAALGIYAVTAFLAGRRRNEIGIRLALGGTRYRLLLLFAGRALASAIIGVLLGFAGSLLVARWMSEALGTRPMDVSTFLWAVGVLTSVAGVAAIVPAHRAVSIDPSNTLRAV